MAPSSRIRSIKYHLQPSTAPCGAATSAVLGAIGGAAVALAGSQLLHRQVSDGAKPELGENNVVPTSASPRPHVVTTEAELRALLPVRTGGSGIADAPKVLDHLDEQMTGFIERSPFLQLGTADAEGLPFVSPKGDHAGFCMILNEKTLIIPDRPGNSILMGLQNVLANPKAGLVRSHWSYQTLCIVLSFCWSRNSQDCAVHE